ncbi:hypothetical protein Lal_00026327 [Lupinus albus]|nr:hypothetical protein Lal_00026327 [Lupinus albus]
MTNIVLCGGMMKDPKVGGGVGVGLRKGKYVYFWLCDDGVVNHEKKRQSLITEMVRFDFLECSKFYLSIQIWVDTSKNYEYGVIDYIIENAQCNRLHYSGNRLQIDKLISLVHFPYTTLGLKYIHVFNKISNTYKSNFRQLLRMVFNDCLDDERDFRDIDS